MTSLMLQRDNCPPVFEMNVRLILCIQVILTQSGFPLNEEITSIGYWLNAWRDTRYRVRWKQTIQV